MAEDKMVELKSPLIGGDPAKLPPMDYLAHGLSSLTRFSTT